MFVKVSRIAPIWPRMATATPRGGVPARAIAASTLADRPAQIRPATFAVSVHHSLSVEAIVFADDRRVVDRATSPSMARERESAFTGTTRRSSRLCISGCGTLTCT
jgi:hypothetical protein